MVVMSRRRVFLIALVAFLLIPAAAFAGVLFSDVVDGSTHFDGIKYMKDTGITLGCGDGTTFCPKDPVLRETMATFMYRMSGNDPATPASVNADKLDGKDSTEFLGKAEKAADADKLDGKNSTEFANSSHTHSNAETTNEPGIALNFDTDEVSATGTPTAMISTSMRAPSDGWVKIEVTGNWKPFNTSGQDGVSCQLQKGTVGAVSTSEPWFYLDDSNDTVGRWSVFSAHRIVPIAAADNPFIFNFGQLLSLVCDEYAGDVRFSDMQITGTFFATSYQPIGIIMPLSDDPSTASNLD
jgi:hypothetical protein